MALTAHDMRDAYLTSWLRGMHAFGKAIASDDPDEIDAIDAELLAAPDLAQNERAHPLDRLAALGMRDGYAHARFGYSDAIRAAPWGPLVPR